MDYSIKHTFSTPSQRTLSLDLCLDFMSKVCWWGADLISIWQNLQPIFNGISIKKIEVMIRQVAIRISNEWEMWNELI